MAELKARMENDSITPQIVNLGHGGIATATPSGTVNILRQPEADVPDYEPYANLFGERGTPQWLKAAQDYVLRGGGPTSMALRTDLKQTVPGGSGGRGGGGLTATARAKYIADAQAAISRGADPDAVHARLRQMGVE